MLDLEQTMQEHPVLGILRNIPLDKTIDYADAAIRGGVSFFEVALNSPCALQQIEMLRDKFGEQCLVGAGTAITPELCQQAIATGAQFLLTPGTPLDVLRYCRDHEIALLPGVLTPTDVAVSMEYGYHAMKLFPAGSMPLRYLKDLQGPFDKTQFMAIGGVWTLAVAVSRLRMGMHFLSDVSVSSLLTIALGAVAVWLFYFNKSFFNKIWAFASGDPKPAKKPRTPEEP